MEVRSADRSPPVFLQVAGHPVRWRLLSELARSDRQVHELTALVDEPQSLVSYHLGRLRAAGLVSVRRSAADGRVVYYAADLARCAQLLSAAGAALHPALGLAPPPPGGAAPPGVRVLFLCTGNSARSQMAEALLRHRAGAGVGVFSAGSHPKPVHPHAVAAMAERGIDLSGRRSKHLDEFAGDRFGHVVTLCDRVRLVCPAFPGDPELIHWSIPDPARQSDGYPAFTRTAAELSARIEFLLRRITSPPLEAR